MTLYSGFIVVGFFGCVFKIRPSSKLKSQSEMETFSCLQKPAFLLVSNISLHLGCDNINPNILTPFAQHEGTNNPHQQASQHTREAGKKESDWVIPKMNVPRSFWAHNTKPAKGNIGII